ncbi:neuropeptide FF receptor 1-like [Osmia bicornis bicornis]|uniref:neuropeptide FF receptor 1-like n=1 Tax=Osmia bicornis bicornis TaxID=1437191 RepID=UPI001EAF6899|nr:neuropeptide FF receptor 1-like [Osmia bicornis bicornis]XP_029048033.2 neuropeptide FF receptor 1-like [Osmia bicornis bicornis]XP_029048044.2 neuropeptide FF receptor 1-like [Osmia bicornis bicornis]
MVSTTSLSSFNNSYNGTTSLNETFKMDITGDILWYFYDKFHSETNYLLIILYVPVIALAVTANTLVIAVVFKYHYMRSVTNYFVVNLSVADLLVTTICMPVAVSQAISIVWIHGEVMCKLSSYLQGVAVAASVFTITAMSIDRYLAIRSPMAFRRVFNRKSTIFVIVALWLVALIIFAPVLRAMTLQSPGMELSNITFYGSWTMSRNFTEDISRVSQRPPAFYICSEDFKPLGIRAHLFGAVCFVLVYAIPGFVVILSYSMMGRTLCSRKPPFDCDSVEGSASSQQSFRLVRERRRIAWILLLLAVLFALCWLPYNVLMLLIDLGAIGEGTVTTNALSYCLFLGHANSALNPIVYCFMTRNFRRSVVEIVCRGSRGLARRRPRRRSIQGTGVIDDVCAGCSAGGNVRRGLLRKRRMLPGCGCGLPIGPHHSVLAVKRTATTSSGYDSFYSRHSPHRRCYMLRSLRGRPQTPTGQAQNANKRQETCSEKNVTISQPRVNTLVTTDEQRCS